MEQHTGQTEEDLGKDYSEKFNTQKGRTEKRGKQPFFFSSITFATVTGLVLSKSYLWNFLEVLSHKN